MTNKDLNALHTITSCFDGLFNAASGKLINIREPEVDMIDIADIAHSLSMICRFGGHSNRFYSVAQHCVIVSAMAPVEIGFEALMHDATEAYLGDVIKPLKIIIGKSYKELEERFMNQIIKRFDLDCANLEQVKKYDMDALVLEHEFLQKDNWHLWKETMERLYIPLYQQHAWSPDYAREMFLHQYRMLLTYKNSIKQHGK